MPSSSNAGHPDACPGSAASLPAQPWSCMVTAPKKEEDSARCFHPVQPGAKNEPCTWELGSGEGSAWVSGSGQRWRKPGWAPAPSSLPAAATTLLVPGFAARAWHQREPCRERQAAAGILGIDPPLAPGGMQLGGPCPMPACSRGSPRGSWQKQKDALGGEWGAGEAGREPALLFRLGNSSSIKQGQGAAR